MRAFVYEQVSAPFVSAAKIPFPRTEIITDGDPIRVCGATIAQEGRAFGVVGTIQPAESVRRATPMP